MNDYELIKRKDYITLWEKYQPLQNIFYHKCIDILSDNHIAFDDYENVIDFMYDAYPIIVKAVDSIDLNKVKKPSSFTLYIQLYHYLQNFITREIINPKIKYSKKELQALDDINPESNGIYLDIDTNFDKIEQSTFVNNIMSKLTEEEKDLFYKASRDITYRKGKKWRLLKKKIQSYN